MLGRVNHIAIAVPDLAKGIAAYRDVLGASVGERQPLPEHGVTVVFVELPNTKVELLEPLGEGAVRTARCRCCCASRAAAAAAPRRR